MPAFLKNRRFRIAIAFASFYLFCPWLWATWQVGHSKVLTSAQGYSLALSPITLGLMLMSLLVDLSLLNHLQNKADQTKFPNYRHYPILHWAWIAFFGTVCTWLAMSYAIPNLDPALIPDVVAHGHSLGAGLALAFFVPLNLHLSENLGVPPHRERAFFWITCLVSTVLGSVLLFVAAYYAGQVNPDSLEYQFKSTTYSLILGIAVNLWAIRGYRNWRKTSAIEDEATEDEESSYSPA